MPDDPREVFERVVAEVYEPLQRYLRRRAAAADLDDLLNDVLLIVWRRIDDVPEDMALPWCCGIARRCLANHRRGTTRRLRLVERVGATTTTEPALHWTDDGDAALHDALARLGDTDREVVRLWAWEGFEPREIAAVLGTTPNAVSVRLARIRRRLTVELARQDGGPAGHRTVEGHPELEP